MEHACLMHSSVSLAGVGRRMLLRSDSVLRLWPIIFKKVGGLLAARLGVHGCAGAQVAAAHPRAQECQLHRVGSGQHPGGAVEEEPVRADEPPCERTDAGQQYKHPPLVQQGGKAADAQLVHTSVCGCSRPA
eukprot:331733-Chlamydomonas_euryale.AAC.8